MSRYRVHVVIPAYNEAESLPMVLRALREQPQALDSLIVVNNASSDSTAIVARREGALVVDEPKRGYGSACLRGISELQKRILPHPACRDIVVFIDADYSDYPEELPRLLEPILHGGKHLVIGSRLSTTSARAAVPVVARLGNTFAMQVLRLLYGVSFSDMGPFRAISWEGLQFLGMQDKTWGWTLEMQIKAARMGLPSTEIAVRYRARYSGKSKISQSLVGAVRAGTKILWVLARYSLMPTGAQSKFLEQPVEPSQAANF